MNLQQAKKVIERAANTGKRLGVFVIDGKVKTTAITTELFREAQQRYPRALIGIYDDRADPQWIVDDVRHCGGAA